VYKATLNGVQTVAVKVVKGQDPHAQVLLARPMPSALFDGQSLLLQ